MKKFSWKSITTTDCMNEILYKKKTAAYKY